MGTILGNILISYDIEKSHTEVKNALELLGYSDRFKNSGDSKVYHLPNKTLWHKKKSSDQAIVDLKNTCNILNANLQKA